MDPFWSFGVLVVAYTVAQAGQTVVDATRDIDAPFRRVDRLPEPSAEAWRHRGPAQRGAWRDGTWPRAHLTVDRDWISVQRRTYVSGTQRYLVERDAVEVVVLAGFARLGASVGVRGPDRASRLTVGSAPWSWAEEHLDRLGWPHERVRPRLLRPFR